MFKIEKLLFPDSAGKFVTNAQYLELNKPKKTNNYGDSATKQSIPLFAFPGMQLRSLGTASPFCSAEKEQGHKYISKIKALPNFIKNIIASQLADCSELKISDIKESVLYPAEAVIGDYIEGTNSFDGEMPDPIIKWCIPDVSRVATCGTSYESIFEHFETKNYWGRYTLSSGAYIVNMGYIGIVTPTGVKTLVCTVFDKDALEYLKLAYILNKEVNGVYSILEAADIEDEHSLFYKQYFKHERKTLMALKLEIVRVPNFDSLVYRMLTPDMSSRASIKKFYDTVFTMFKEQGKGEGKKVEMKEVQMK